MAKVYPGEYTLADIANVAQSASSRTAVTPFGAPALGIFHRYVGRAVAWKMFRKAPGESLDEYLKRFKESFPEQAGVADGLRKSVDMSKAHAGISGVSLVLMSDGSLMIMPTKSAKQSIGKAVTITVKGKSRKKLRVVKIVTSAPSYRKLMARIPAVVGVKPAVTAIPPVVGKAI